MPQLELLFIFDQIFAVSLFFVISVCVVLFLDVNFKLNELKVWIDRVRLIAFNVKIFLKYKPLLFFQFIKI